MSKRFSVANTIAFWVFEAVGGGLGLVIGGAFRYPIAGFNVGLIVGGLTYFALDSRFSSADK
jgi:hypothetical protein